MPTIYLEDPAGDIIEKIAVVRDDEDGAGVVNQVLLQPSNGFGIQVVGGLIKQQHIRLLEQQSAQRHAARFTARKIFGHRIVWWAAQCLHTDINLGI